MVIVSIWSMSQPYSHTMDTCDHSYHLHFHVYCITSAEGPLNTWSAACLKMHTVFKKFYDNLGSLEPVAIME